MRRRRPTSGRHDGPRPGRRRRRASRRATASIPHPKRPVSRRSSTLCASRPGLCRAGPRGYRCWTTQPCGDRAATITRDQAQRGGGRTRHSRRLQELADAAHGRPDSGAPGAAIGQPDGDGLARRVAGDARRVAELGEGASA
jgi:hypothetical protein